MTRESTQTIHTRRVHYISGYDPRGSRFYHRLYREESVKQAKLSGAVFEVGARQRLGENNSRWSVIGIWKDQKVETEYQFMGWDDLVRRHWETLGQLFFSSLPVYLKYILVGGFNRVAKASRNAFFTSVYPMYYLLLLAVLILMVAVLGGLGAAVIFKNALPAILVAGLIFIGLGSQGLKRADRAGVIWLLRTCIFVVKWGSNPFRDIEGRINEIADHIIREQQERPVDEVLIVGHSIGTMVSLRVVARILERQPSGKALQKMHFVTLGQCIPYLGVMPKAQSFRDDLGVVAGDVRIPWTDFTAPPDPLCFFKVNPMRASGVFPVPENRPRQFIVRIFRMFTKETYSGMRRDKLRLHFQYLMASELPADYDYFLITAGPHLMRDHIGQS